MVSCIDVPQLTTPQKLILIPFYRCFKVSCGFYAATEKEIYDHLRNSYPCLAEKITIEVSLRRHNPDTPLNVRRFYYCTRCRCYFALPALFFHLLGNYAHMISEYPNQHQIEFAASRILSEMEGFRGISFPNFNLPAVD